MPSEPDRTQEALRALAPSIERFETALAATIEELRGFLDAHRGGPEEADARLGAELGRFAMSRIDPARFSTLIAPKASVDVETLHVVEQAMATLGELRARGDDLFVARVAPGGDLRTAVTDALAEAGRAFGVARSLRFVWNGVPSTALDDPRDAFSPWRWNPAERELAPPLVVEVGGRDLSAAGLADLLEGNQKIVLITSGPAPVAPLARLLTPGLWVVQADQAEAFLEMTHAPGAGIAAWLPSECARFVHRPGGGSFSARIEMQSLPEKGTGRSLGRVAAAREANDLEHLRELLIASPARTAVEAAPAGAVPSAAPTPEPGFVGAKPQSAEPVDRLAGWLLAQAGLAAGQ